MHLDFGAITAQHFDALADLACEIEQGSPSSARGHPVYSRPVRLARGPYHLAHAAQCADTVMVEGFQRGRLGHAWPSTDLAWLEQQATYLGGRRAVSSVRIAGGLRAGLGRVRRRLPDSGGGSCHRRQHRARIELDPAHGGPFFQYTDTTGKLHSVWKDSASILLKLATLDSMGVRKVALWRLGAVPRISWPIFAISSIAARGVAVCMSKDIL